MMANGNRRKNRNGRTVGSRTAKLRTMADIRLVPSEEIKCDANPAGAGRTQNHFQCRELESAGQLTERAMRVIVL